MKFYHAGAKPESKAHPWDSPWLAAEQPINIMITYWEFRERKQGKKKSKFLKEQMWHRDRKEHWKWIPGYKGYYKASTRGRIKSVDRWIEQSNGKGTTYKRKMSGAILGTGKNSSGYIHVWLWKDNKEKCYDIHTLILKTFVGPCPDGKESRHWDDDKANNHINNLFYGTHEDNCRDRKRNGLNGDGFRKLTMKKAKKIRRLRFKGKSYGHLSRRFKLSVQAVRNIVKRKTYK